MTVTSVCPAFSGLLPHAPILIPEVGGANLGRCRSTHDGCRDLARRLCAASPDRLVLVSPHAPQHPSALGIYAGQMLRGDLRQFGVPRVGLALQADTAFGNALLREASAMDVETWEIRDAALDHGAVVPLWFLVHAGWQGPTAVLSLPSVCERTRLRAFGQVVARAADRLPGRAALVASGDMTHRAESGPLAGSNERAVEFDRQMIQLVRHGDLAGIADIDPSLRELAAEDAADSTAVIATAIGNRPSGNEVLSYEHPFGVGYLVAVLHDGRNW